MAKPIPFRMDANHDDPDQDTDTSASEESFSTEDLRTYTNEEVSEIIRLALVNAGHEDRDTVNHDEMLAIGKDFGLSQEDIDRAFVAVENTQQNNELEKHAHMIFLIHLATYTAINVGLFILNIFTGLDTVWFVYPLVAWGSVMAIHLAITKFAVGWIVDITSNLEDTNAIAHGDPLSMDFTIPDLYSSMAEANGMIHIEDSGLLLEFETIDSIFGAIKSKPKEVFVEFKDITSVQLERGLWETKLHVRGRKLHCFTDVPGCQGGEAILVISRQMRLAAERFTRELAERVAKAR